MEDVEKWTKDMCMGLWHMHTLMILHRDLKPSNCFLQCNPAGQMSLKIGDFGNSTFLIGRGGKQFTKFKALTNHMTTFRYATLVQWIVFEHGAWQTASLHHSRREYFWW